MAKDSFFGFVRSGLISIFFFAYRFIGSPFFHAISGAGSGCRYPETCSVYSERVLREKGLLLGSRLAVQRIISCNPWVQGPWERHRS